MGYLMDMSDCETDLGVEIKSHSVCLSSDTNIFPQDEYGHGHVEIDKMALKDLYNFLSIEHNWKKIFNERT